MATLTITIPDTVAPEAIDALCEAIDYTAATGRNVAAQKAIKEYLRALIRERRRRLATQTVNDPDLGA